MKRDGSGDAATGPRIGLWGTFDVDNYGDLLYPLITRMELGRRLPDARLRVQAPAGVLHPIAFQGAHPAEPLGPWSEARLDALAEELDLGLVGGGDIGHVRDVEAYPHPYGLQPDAVEELGPSRFFIDGLGPERERAVPVVWNAVGVPFPFDEPDAARVRRALEARPYVAVRDEVSKRHLEAAGVEREIEVVPDPTLLLPRLFPPEELEDTVDYLRVMSWYPPEGRPLVIQAGGHVLPWASELAAALARIATGPVVAIQTGPCHDDAAFVEALRLYMTRPVYRLPSAVRIEDVAAAITGADVFVGSSFHGNLTALAYGRPHVMLDPTRSSKAEGYARMTAGTERMVRRPADLAAAMEQARAAPTPDADPMRRGVDRHFDRIAELAAGRGRSPDRGEDALWRSVTAGHRAADRRVAELHQVVHDRVWRLREDLRLVGERRPTRRPSHGPIGRLARRVGRALGIPLVRGRLGPDERYRLWLRSTLLSPSSDRRYRHEAAALRYRPTISVVMPVFNTDPVWLREAIDSVRHQAYGEWELCIADDGSTRESTTSLLRRTAGEDPRIRIRFLERNVGISSASNAALSMATGEFVALLDHDDELRPNALLEVVKLLNDSRDLDYVYTDEDKKDRDGNFIEPYFKPDWSPELLLSANYATHLSVFRRSLLDGLGGFREGYEGSQDYDLIVRATEATERIGHVPLPVYSWRQIPGSAAGSVAAKPYAYDAAKRALADALRRRGEDGEVLDGHGWGHYRVRFAIPAEPTVSILVPVRDAARVGDCLQRLEQRSTWRNREVLLAARDRGDAASLDHLGWPVVTGGGGGFGDMVNRAAEVARGEYLVVLHDDTLVIEPAWIEAMLEHGQHDRVAVVGSRMCLPDGAPQHEGLVVAPDGAVIRLAQRGYFGFDRMVHNRSAVSDACMMVRRDVFRELGGYDNSFRSAFHDVDLCLRALEKGYRVVYTPYALVTHEDRGHGREDDEGDGRAFRRRWAGYRDPYYNPNFGFDVPYRLDLDGRA